MYIFGEKSILTPTRVEKLVRHDLWSQVGSIPVNAADGNELTDPVMIQGCAQPMRDGVTLYL